MFNNLNKSGNNLNINGKPNLILLGAATLLGFVIIIITYYVLTSKNTKKASGEYKLPVQLKASNESAESKTDETPADVLSKDDERMPLDEKEVFNNKRNIYALEDAEAACKVFDAEVASLDQVIDAHKKGANWCNVGWTKDGVAAYPVQKAVWDKVQLNDPDKRNECGLKPGVNIARSDSHLLYGVNCFGKKPDPRGLEKIKTKYLSDREKRMLLKYNEFKKNQRDMSILPFNEDDWSYSS